MVFSGYMPSSGIAGSMVVLFLVFNYAANIPITAMLISLYILVDAFNMISHTYPAMLLTT